MSDPVRLTVQWKVEPESVAVTYRVTNAGPQPVYVIDGSFQGSPGGIAWSDRLQVGFQQPETAVLSSKLLPLNPLVSTTFPPAAFAVCVPAGESHQSKLAAPLPLVPDGTTTTPQPPAAVVSGTPAVSPYPGGAPLVSDRSVLCRVARFELGVVPQAAQLRAVRVELAGREVFRLEAPAWSLQRLVTATQRPVELAMLVPAAFLKTG